MISEWKMVYRNPEKTMEIWELRHRSGALLAGLDSRSIWSNNIGGWDTNGAFLSGRSYERFSGSGRHRHELRMLRARIQSSLAALDGQDSPASLTDFIQLNDDVIASMIASDGSRRSRRRRKRAERSAEIDRLIEAVRREADAERFAEIAEALEDYSLWLAG